MIKTGKTALNRTDFHQSRLIYKFLTSTCLIKGTNGDMHKKCYHKCLAMIKGRYQGIHHLKLHRKSLITKKSKVFGRILLDIQIITTRGSIISMPEISYLLKDKA